MKDFSGYQVCSTSNCVTPYNGKIVERTIKKAFPKDKESTLYIVKIEGIHGHIELYEDEMVLSCSK